MTAPAWCNCGEYRTEDGHPVCPVCADRGRKTAEAKVAAMGWRIHGTGGRA
jgi:hypothetical protein